MKVGVVGLGLGYSLAYYLETKGHEVWGVDIREEAYTNPRLDPTMRKFVKDYHGLARPRFSTDFRTIQGCVFVLIFVSTPFDFATGRLSMMNVLEAVNAARLVNPDATYLVLSTLPIGGFDELRRAFPKLRMFYCPPMVKKADFLNTFRRPPSGWQLIGVPEEIRKEIREEAVGDVLRFYAGLVEGTLLVRPYRVVEAAKLCTNLLLSAKIILANAIGDWIADPDRAREVCEIVGADPRVGEGYFTPFISKAAGPCFPRDLEELYTVSSGHLEQILTVLNAVNGTARLIEGW